jgi:HK97 family phage major capsid protein
VNPEYRANGYWLMNDLVISTVRKIVGSDGHPVVVPATAGGMPTLFDRPVVAKPNMPTSGAQAAVILFGDFESYYAIRDVRGLRLERSDDFRFASNQLAFRAVLRSDAKQVLNDSTNSAVKPLRPT